MNTTDNRVAESFKRSTAANDQRRRDEASVAATAAIVSGIEEQAGPDETPATEPGFVEDFHIHELKQQIAGIKASLSTWLSSCSVEDLTRFIKSLPDVDRGMTIDFKDPNGLFALVGEKLVRTWIVENSSFIAAKLQGRI